MPQHFPRWTNVASRASIYGLVLALALLAWMGIMYTRSAWGTNAGETVVQPVPFSHQHHVGILGIDCRYCHTSAESAVFAGLPPTKTCMNCHSQIWVGSDTLAPVRESYRSNRSIRWVRVYNLPGFVYFAHTIHVQKGIGCTTCHGRINEMPLTEQVPSLLMKWCLDCHRDPASQVRPREEVFNVAYVSPPDQASLGATLVKEYSIRSPTQLTSCSVCHR